MLTTLSLRTLLRLLKILIPVNSSEDLALSESEMSVLSKGLNFIPISKKSDESALPKLETSYCRGCKLNWGERSAKTRIHVDAFYPQNRVKRLKNVS